MRFFKMMLKMLYFWVAVFWHAAVHWNFIEQLELIESAFW